MLHDILQKAGKIQFQLQFNTIYYIELILRNYVEVIAECQYYISRVCFGVN